MFHKWKKVEDEVVAAYALAGRTKAKDIKALATLLGLSEAQVSFRMTNYIKQKKNPVTNWHCSSQERRVFWGLSLI